MWVLLNKNSILISSYDPTEASYTRFDAQHIDNYNEKNRKTLSRFI